MACTAFPSCCGASIWTFNTTFIPETFERSLLEYVNVSASMGVFILNAQQRKDLDKILVKYQWYITEMSKPIINRGHRANIHLFQFDTNLWQIDPALVGKPLEPVKKPTKTLKAPTKRPSLRRLFGSTLAERRKRLRK